MKTLLIAGSRTLHPTIEQIEAQKDDLLFHLSEVELLVSGGAEGADLAGERWAKHRGIRIQRMTPNYTRRDPRVAPKYRNRDMARFLSEEIKRGRLAGAILFWDGMSGGTAHMAAQLLGRDIPTRLKFLNPTK